MNRCPTIGLTGGIAAGKSTVAEMLRSRGALVVDTDRIAHGVMARGGAAYAGVVAAFGEGILDAEGEIDRRVLGDLVFRDAGERARLNAAVHPHIRREWTGTVRRLQNDPAAVMIVVAVPLLYEVGVEDEFDAVVAVVCSEDTAVRRIRERGLDEEQARLRLAAQLPMQEKADRADYVIYNDFSMVILADQVDRLWRRLADPKGTPVGAASRTKG